MKVIIIGIILWWIAQRLENARQRRRLQRVQAEQHRQREEQERLRRAQAQYERAQAIIAREQQRQAKILQRHELEIEKLSFQITQAQHDIKAERNRVNQLHALLDIALAAQSEAIPGSPADEKAQRKIIALENQINNSEKRIRTAEHKKLVAQQKLNVA